MARKAAAAAIALILLSATAGAAGSPSKAKRGSPSRKGAVRQLDEVKIVGNPERPDILFFLPRAKFRLLPMKDGVDWREEIVRDDVEKAGLPR